MITEYTDCTELMRLIIDQKIKPSAVKRYFSTQGIVITSSNAKTVAEDVYTITLGAQEITQITRLIVNESNYEKSTLINAKFKTTDETSSDIIDFFTDGFNQLRSSGSREFSIEQPIKTDSSLSVRMSYIRKLPGKNKLIQDETRYVNISLRKKSNSEVTIDIRQPSSTDAQRALDLLERIAGKEDETNVVLLHINLDSLTDKNKVSFFDKLSASTFSSWKLKTVTGITVKKSTLECEDIDNELESDDEEIGTLTGISQAVLNGSGLRSNEFVKNSLEQGYYISSIRLRYMCTQEASEFIVSISSKGKNLRVDMEKSYYEEDGIFSLQPFPKIQQDEIIQQFQNTANSIYLLLLDEQKRQSTSQQK